MDVERAIEYLQECVSRLRHDVSMLSAQLEVIRTHIQTKQDLIDDLRVLQADTKVAQARTEALEHRAEQAEHLAQQIESETIHRAELTNWRRAQRRFTWLIATVLVFIATAILVGYFVAAHNSNDVQMQVAKVEQHFCDFLKIRSTVRGTPADDALANEAAKLTTHFGCR